MLMVESVKETSMISAPLEGFWLEGITRKFSENLFKV